MKLRRVERNIDIPKWLSEGGLDMISRCFHENHQQYECYESTVFAQPIFQPKNTLRKGITRRMRPSRLYECLGTAAMHYYTDSSRPKGPLTDTELLNTSTTCMKQVIRQERVLPWKQQQTDADDEGAAVVKQ